VLEDATNRSHKAKRGDEPALAFVPGWLGNAHVNREIFDLVLKVANRRSPSRAEALPSTAFAGRRGEEIVMRHASELEPGDGVHDAPAGCSSRTGPKKNRPPRE
jgi:hypothetical protein